MLNENFKLVFLSLKLHHRSKTKFPIKFGQILQEIPNEIKKDPLSTQQNGVSTKREQRIH